MNEVQRAIKYCAIAFAIILTVTIISAIASAAFTVVRAVSGGTMETGRWNKKTIPMKMKNSPHIAFDNLFLILTSQRSNNIVISIIIILQLN